MSFWSRTLRVFGFGGLNKREGLQNPAPDHYNKTQAAPVDFDGAMGVSAFWASARLLSETVAGMPLRCYRNEGPNIREENTNYPLWRLLNYQPNRYQTRTEFFETLMLNLVCWGNWYVGIEKDSRGRPVSLIPLMSSQMSVDLQEDGSTIYTYYTANGDVRAYSDESIWHVKLFGNGVIGLSPLAYARQTLGIAIATDNRVAEMARNGGKTSGILTIDNTLTPEQRKKIRANFNDLTQGPGDSLFVLEAGMNYQQTSISPQDMQLIENRRFQVEDIARFMGVPSVLINDTSGSTTWGSGIEQIVTGFYKLNLRPYLERIESSLKKHLMNSRDWSEYDIEFDFDALLRADLASRVESYNKAINSGQLTPNEARANEGRQSMPGGDTIYLNGTLVPAGQQRQQTGVIPNGTQTSQS